VHDEEAHRPKTPRQQECTAKSTNTTMRDYSPRSHGSHGSHGSGSRYNEKKLPKPWIKEPDKFYVHFPGQTPPAFGTVKEAVETKIAARGGEFEDVVQSIRDLKTFDLKQMEPKRKQSVKEDPEAKKFEQDTFDTEHRVELQTHSRRQDTLRRNLKTAYAIILNEFTSKLVQERVRAIPGLYHFVGDPIELLKRIRGQMEDTGVAQCSMISDQRMMDKYNNINQGYSESLTDYAQRFKQTKDALDQSIGTTISDCFAHNHKEYKALADGEERLNYLIAYRDKSQACHFIQKSNNSYHQIKTDLSRSFALGNDLYPENLNAAIEALTHYRTDYRTIGEPNKRSIAKADEVQDNTKKQETTSTSFFQDNTRCLCCGSRGHRSDQCHKRHKTPKSKWWVDKAEAPKSDSDEEDEQSQGSQRSDTASETSSTKKNKKRFKKQKHLPSNFTTTVSSSNKYKTSFHKEHKNNIVLDTGCSVPALYCNPALVYDIRPASEPLCMATSTGMVYLTKKATVPVIGEVWYDPDQPTNLLSFGHMYERFKIKHDTQDDTFNLQMKNGDNMKFVKKNYLYTYTPSRQYMQTIRRTKQRRRSQNRGRRMKTRSQTRSNQPVIGMSNLCLTHADTNHRDPWQQSRFAGVPDSIGDSSDHADDNGSTTEYYDNEIDNNGTETDDEASNNGDRSDNETDNGDRSDNETGTDADNNNIYADAGNNGIYADGNAPDYNDTGDACCFIQQM